MIQFWAVTWATGSKKWLKYQGCLQNTKNIVTVRVFRGPWTLPCPQHESQSHVVQNFSGTVVLVGKKVGLVPEGPNDDVKGLYGVFLLVPLP